MAQATRSADRVVGSGARGETEQAGEQAGPRIVAEEAVYLASQAIAAQAADACIEDLAVAAGQDQWLARCGGHQALELGRGASQTGRVDVREHHVIGVEVARYGGERFEVGATSAAPDGTDEDDDGADTIFE